VVAMQLTTPHPDAPSLPSARWIIATLLLPL
jgi:hypothetical protein